MGESKATGRWGWLRWAGPVGAAFGAVLALWILRASVSASELPRIGAVALLLVCAHELWCRRALFSPLRRRIPPRAIRFGRALRLASVGPYLVLGVAAVVALWPASIGDMPIGQDHAYHYFGTRLLVDDLLAEGRFFGWTDRFCTGLPVGDAYASGAYLFSAAPHLLSFGAISLRAGYGFFIFAVWLVAALAVAALSHRLVRPSVGVADKWTWVAPLLAGGLFLIDPGGDRQGGWLYSMFYGVWPQYLATALFVVALLALFRLSERQTVTRFGLAVLSVGAALWAHPMSAPNLLVAVPLLMLTLVLSRGLAPDDERKGGPSAEPRRGALWVGLATMLGGAIGYAWFSHLLFASEHEFVTHYGNAWESIEALGLRLLEGELFYNDTPWIAVFALVGAIAVLRRPHRDGVVVIAAFCMFFVLCAMEPLVSYDFGTHPEHKGVMFSRFSITMKPFWYALAGAGGKLAVDGIRRYAGPAGVVPRYGVRVLLLLCVAPVMWGLWLALPSYPDVPAAQPVTPITAELEEELAVLDQVLAAEARRLGDRPKRAVLWIERGQHGTYSLVPLADHGFGFLPTRKPPAHVFRYPNITSNMELLKWQGASVLISRTEHRQADEFELLAALPHHFVYRIQDDPTWPVRVENGGEVEILSWEPHRRVLRLSGTNPTSLLVVGSPPYDKWHASQAGQARPLADHARIANLRYTEIPHLSDGDLVLEYEDSEEEEDWGTRGLVVVLLAGLALPFFWVSLPRLVRGRALPVVAALGVVFALAVAAKGLDRLAEFRDESIDTRWLEGEPDGARVIDVIHQRMPLWWEREPSYYCVRPYTRTQDPECEDAVLEPILVRGRERRNNDERNKPHDPPRPQLEIPSCLRFGAPTDGRVRLLWAVPEGATIIKGRLRDENRQPASGRVEAGGRTLGQVRTDDQIFRFELPAGSDRFAIELEPTGRRTSLACFEGVFLRAP